jgi:hypothetical protein
MMIVSDATGQIIYQICPLLIQPLSTDCGLLPFVVIIFDGQ